VRLIGETKLDLSGRAVLLVDDIVDTGRTLLYARDLIREKKTSSVLTCALIDKPSRREVAIDPDFVGFTVPDVFIVGYGIDYAHQYRQLPFIGMID
jgi:hypoxanthine phosphoribosyltransferase